jgi:arylsulfatase A-like enzyme
MTGRDSIHAGIWTTTTDRSMLFADLSTVAETFAANGYRTAMYGKWHLGAVPPYRPQDRGFQESLYEPGGMIGMAVEAWGNDVIDATYQHNGTQKRFNGYRTDIWFREAIKWMKQRQDKGEPFFAYIATLAPHGPHWVPARYSEPYRHLDKPGQRRGVADFFGMIANIDENMGRLETFLQASGLRENTILIFMTDNGGTAGVRIHNAGMKGHKGSLYEGGHRVPCFVRWPAGGIGGGKDLNPLTSHLDWFPTFVDLCGLKNGVPEKLEGFSMAAVLRAQTDRMPTRFLFQRSDHSRVKEGASYRPARRDTAVLSDQWRFVNDAELYDIHADPGQEHDIAAEHPGRVAAMRRQLTAYWRSVFPASYDWPRPIQVGTGEEVVITPLYGRPVRGKAGGFQVHIRVGHTTLSQWFLNVAEAGRYQIELRRWPRIVDAAITDPLPPLTGEFVRHPPGKALPVASMRLQVGKREWTKEVGPDDKAVIFDVELESADATPLTARMLDIQGKEIADVFYMYVSRTRE